MDPAPEQGTVIPLEDVEIVINIVVMKRGVGQNENQLIVDWPRDRPTDTLQTLGRTVMRVTQEFAQQIVRADTGKRVADKPEPGILVPNHEQTRHLQSTLGLT